MDPVTAQAIDGTVLRYGSKPAHVALVSPPVSAGESGRAKKKALVAVGGLSCGLLYAEYLQPLYAELQGIDMHLCQPLLSSSHGAWGVGSVSEDAEELRILLECLAGRYDFSEFIILGHSTGCQDAVMYMRKFARGRGFDVTGVVLQGPVSDREFLHGFLPDTAERIRLCRAMVEKGKAEDIAFVFREFGDMVPVTARRFLSLADVGGEDDCFSSKDLDLEEALRSLRGTPTLVLMSGKDECQVTYGIDPAAIGERLVEAIGESARLVVVDGGLHDLRGTEASALAAKIIAEFARDISTS